MMKRIFLVVFVFCLMFASTALGRPYNACYTNNITASDIIFGGITRGTSLAYVEQVYGKPTKIFNNDRNPRHYYVTYAYGNLHDKHLWVTAIKRDDGTTFVTTINCEAGNLATNSGLRVGMPVSKIVKRFGTPSRITLAGPSGDKCYSYTDDTNNLLFLVNPAGVVKSVGLSWND